MKLFLYNLILLILTPIFGFRILYKSLYDKDYRSYFIERFGKTKIISRSNKVKRVIWFHAVSLGEVIGSENIVQNLLNDADIVLTVTTPTGLEKQESYIRTVILK